MISKYNHIGASLFPLNQLQKRRYWEKKVLHFDAMNGMRSGRETEAL
jgi:hypothetical protein